MRTVNDDYYTPDELIEALQALPESLRRERVAHGWDSGEIYVWLGQPKGDVEIISLFKNLSEFIEKGDKNGE